MGELRLCGLALALAACGREASVVSEPGADCGALIAAGEQARACDPAIAGLVDELRSQPDERRCRAAARELLAPQAPPGRIVSVYEATTPVDAGPLTAAERAGLARLVLPGTLRVTPARASGPGVPVTTAELGGAPLASDGAGELHGMHAPGEHTLVLRHAHAEARACVTLRACETVALTANGAELAPHPSLRMGLRVGSCP